MKRESKKTFFELAKRYIIKGKKGGDPNLSLRIDEILYGVEKGNTEAVTVEYVLQWGKEAKKLYRAGKLPRLK